MLIGLLEAETLPDKVVAQFGSYGNMFEQLLNQSDPRFQFRYYQADQEQLPSDINECDAYIITGSRHNAYDHDPWIENLKSLVREINEAKKKCLGICFGHQLIAEALGGKVEKSEKGWGIGVAEFDIQHRHPLMPNNLERFTILVSHQDQVVRLPTKALHLASNDFCRFGAFFIGDHLLSIQGHPEFSADYVKFLIHKRKNVIGAEISDKALKSLIKIKIQRDIPKFLSSFFTAPV